MIRCSQIVSSGSGDGDGDGVLALLEIIDRNEYVVSFIEVGSEQSRRRRTPSSHISRSLQSIDSLEPAMLHLSKCMNSKAVVMLSQTLCWYLRARISKSPRSPTGISSNLSEDIGSNISSSESVQRPR